MRSPDPTLGLTMDVDVAPVGGRFEGRLDRMPHLDDSQEAGKHRIQGVRLELGYTTEGRGDTDGKIVDRQQFRVDDWGRLSAPFRVDVPGDAPISYDGRLIRLRWSITATVMIKMGLDRPLEIPVVVVPVNGESLYAGPHPLTGRSSRRSSREGSPYEPTSIERPHHPRPGPP